MFGRASKKNVLLQKDYITTYWHWAERIWRYHDAWCQHWRNDKGKLSALTLSLFSGADIEPEIPW